MMIQFFKITAYHYNTICYVQYQRNMHITKSILLGILLKKHIQYIIIAHQDKHVYLNLVAPYHHDNLHFTVDIILYVCTYKLITELIIMFQKQPNQLIVYLTCIKVNSQSANNTFSIPVYNMV